jgi:farnesyl diphosphate synthase
MSAAMAEAVGISPAALKQSLSDAAARIEATLDAVLVVPDGSEAILFEAMRYAVLGGGKRLRGYLVLQTASLFGVSEEAALRVAASVEMLHAYSLVHDDLPAMDDDDLRRGQPSTHRRFDEATAILAGDALQTMAFELLVDPALHEDPSIRAELALALARASGAHGMVGGQVIDMQGEGKSLALDAVRRLHALKTGALIRYAAEAGAILGRADPDARARIAAYGRDIGTAFQVADDVLDATASDAELGKTAGKDLAAGKSTYVSLLGIEGAGAEAQRLCVQAQDHLKPFGHSADYLKALAQFVVERRN